MPDGGVLPPAPEEREAFTAWRLFLGAHAVLVGGLDAALREEAGLPLTWYDVLVHVSEAPDRRIRLHDLEARVFLSQSAVSRLAGRLEEAGLVERSVPGDDRRGVEVALTDAGLERFAAGRAVAMQYVRRSFASLLTQDDARSLVDVLGRLRAGAGRA